MAKVVSTRKIMAETLEHRVHSMHVLASSTLPSELYLRAWIDNLLESHPYICTRHGLQGVLLFSDQ